MSARILDGRLLALSHRERLCHDVLSLKARGISPSLVVILVGDHPSSQIYVRNKVRACEDVGIHVEIRTYPETVSQNHLHKHLEDLNKNPTVHGILIQLPLPEHIHARDLLNAIHPQKDVDGLHPENLGKLFINDPWMIPCTPQGCLDLIRQGIPDLSGKTVAVMGRSLLVGRPLAALLSNHNATVTLIHQHSPLHLTQKMDILVVAIGVPEYVTEENIRPGAMVIDVGIHKRGEGLIGDVNRSSVEKVAGFLSPVPGGVGPMTITYLLSNVLKAAHVV